MGGVAIGTIVTIVATVIFVKVRRNRPGKQYRDLNVYMPLSTAFLI